MNEQNSVKIINPGLRSILVDSGRVGLQGQGFCQGGALDEEAYRWANWLCCNPPGTPAIESMGTTAFKLDQAGIIAVTGKGGKVSINGKIHSFWESIGVSKDAEINILPEFPISRHYLAIGGQWDVAPVAGSVTTVVREQLGGHHQNGLPIKAAETIPLKHATGKPGREMPPSLIPDYSLKRPIEVIPGYQVNQFSRVALQVFYSSQYAVTDQIDRMGYRLKGAAVPATITEMHSEGINLGAIQIPGDGQPIVMMKDRQTLGGYPKLGCVARYDLPRLAQAAPGDRVRFVSVEAENARATWLLKQRRLNLLSEG